ncbi:MAG TPA: GspMb/PilO family protein [Vicinamibacteria bacterium]|nr:GspMb/PilO family protein [Vicinamibacteria bacterium]
MSVVRPLWQRWLVPAAAALAALNLVEFAAWTLPREHSQRHAAVRAEGLRAAVRRQRSEAAALRERAAAISANAGDLERFYTRYAGTEKADLVPTLETVEDLARLPGLRPGPRGYSRQPVAGTPLERLAITLPLEGSYEQLVSFLGEVERSPRFLTVDGVSMQGGRVGGGNAQLRVELSTYLKLDEGVRTRSGRAR